MVFIVLALVLFNDSAVCVVTHFQTSRGGDGGPVAGGCLTRQAFDKRSHYAAGNLLIPVNELRHLFADFLGQLFRTERSVVWNRISNVTARFFVEGETPKIMTG